MTAVVVFYSAWIRWFLDFIAVTAAAEAQLQQWAKSVSSQTTSITFATYLKLFLFGIELLYV